MEIKVLKSYEIKQSYTLTESEQNHEQIVFKKFDSNNTILFYKCTTLWHEYVPQNDNTKKIYPLSNIYHKHAL